MINQIHNNDCLVGLKEYPDNFFDSVLTDPPYGLSSPPPIENVLRLWLDGEDYKHEGKGFMNKEWDSFVPNPSIWREVFRVLKPGGHILCFAGTRTVDLMGVSLRLAGFEIRDTIQWLYGSGFPKSMNIGKAIDKKNGIASKVVGIGRSGKAETHTRTMNSLTDSGKSVFGGEYEITEAQNEWAGWGTALKPANEPIILARKPLSEKTIVENVLRWGTGGLNIDGCRIPTEDNLNDGGYSENYTTSGFLKYGGKLEYKQPTGRFPANVILDEEAGRMMDEQSGVSTSTAGIRKNKFKARNAFRSDKPKDVYSGHSDSGGASRFFYCPKANKKDRGEGNNHPTVKPTDLLRYLARLITPPNGVVLDPFIGSGSTALACKAEGFKYVGFEIDPDYCKLARSRVGDRRQQVSIEDLNVSKEMEWLYK